MPPEPVAAHGVYLAGPLGFSDSGRLFHRQVLVPSVAACGAVVLDPWDAPFDDMSVAMSLPEGSERAQALKAANRRHGEHNAELIRACALVFAVLDGADVDSGTAAEVGYACALGKPIIGWRGDLRSTGDNDACLVNLQVEHFIEESGGALFTDLDDSLREVCKRLGHV